MWTITRTVWNGKLKTTISDIDECVFLCIACITHHPQLKHCVLVHSKSTKAWEIGCFVLVFWNSRNDTCHVTQFNQSDDRNMCTRCMIQGSYPRYIIHVLSIKGLVQKISYLLELQLYNTRITNYQGSYKAAIRSDIALTQRLCAVMRYL